MYNLHYINAYVMINVSLKLASKYVLFSKKNDVHHDLVIFGNWAPQAYQKLRGILGV